MSLYCPYCDSTEVELKDELRTSSMEDDDTGPRKMVIRRLVCRECGEVGYAFAVYRPDGDFVPVRRDQLAARTGVRIRTPVSRRRWTA